jgi:hypothetical protein
MFRYSLASKLSATITLALTCAWPLRAAAQGKIDLDTEAPAPAEQRSYHVHDGFYLRASFGIGTLGADFDDGGPSNIDFSGSGFAMAFDALVGGSPAPGVAIGGALLTTGAFSIAFDQGGRDAGDRNVGLAVLGVFIDGFPDKSGGWHLGGALGLSAMDIENDASISGLQSTRGIGGAAWVGYDAWVASEWSVGGLFRLTGALTQDADDSVDVSAAAFGGTIMFSALYH